MAGLESAHVPSFQELSKPYIKLEAGFRPLSKLQNGTRIWKRQSDHKWIWWECHLDVAASSQCPTHLLSLSHSPSIVLAVVPSYMIFIPPCSPTSCPCPVPLCHLHLDLGAPNIQECRLYQISRQRILVCSTTMPAQYSWPTSSSSSPASPLCHILGHHQLSWRRALSMQNWLCDPPIAAVMDVSEVQGTRV